MEMLSASPVAQEDNAGARQNFREFLALRLGGEQNAAAFLAHFLLPAMRAAHPSDETMVVGWFTRLFRKTYNDHIARQFFRREGTRAYLACGGMLAREEEQALRACLGHVVDGLTPASGAVLRQVEFNGASLWLAGTILHLSVHAVWARLQVGRAECRACLIQFVADCAMDPIVSAPPMAVGE